MNDKLNAPMTPERWQQVEQLLQAALKHEPAERTALLDRECADDHELREEVESLLVSAHQADRFLEAHALDDAAVLLRDADSDDPLIGKHFGPYSIEKLLGSGGMGVVYLAEDKRLGRKVALKLLDPALAGDKDWRTRFLREARLASALDHPNICTVHEVGEVRGRPFIAMQYVEGQTLKQVIGNRSLSLESVLSTSLQVADALALAHQQGVVHRDIKSANIIITPRGQAKVLDFGLAKLLEHIDKEDQTHLTMTGAVMGTPASMSPEQARGDRADHRSDIFSFGVVMYEMATGRTPFRGRSKADVISALLKERQTPAWELNEEIPTRLSAMIDRMLAKEPAERYQSMPEVIVDLRQVVAEVGGLDRLFSSSDPSRGMVPLVPPQRQSLLGAVMSAAPAIGGGSLRGRHTAFFLAGGLLLALLIASGYEFWRDKLLEDNHSRPIAVPFAQAISKQLTTKGKVRWVALSPDGKFYVYVLTERDERSESLWLGQIDAGNDIQLRPPAGVYAGLAFSPDGKTLYFTLRGELQSGFFRMHMLGGVAEKLSDLLTNFSLSPDGKQIAFLRSSKEQDGSALVIANLEDTQERELLTRPADKNFSVNCTAWSPDGSMIAIAAITDSIKVSREIFTVRVADGHLEQLTTFEWSRISNLLWQRNGQGLILVGTNKSETLRHLWQVDYPDGNPRRLSRDTDSYGAGLSLSADGDSLVAVQIKRESNIWVAPSDDLSKARQVTFSSINGIYGWEGIDWTPNGSLVFTAGVERSIALCLMDADGSNIKSITSPGFFDQKPKVTVDGRFIVFQSNRSGGNEVWRIQPDGSGLRQLTTGGGNSSPYPTPDGKWVIYISTSGGKNFVWRVSMEGGAAVQVTNKDSSDPSVSPDGKLIACTYKADDNAPLKLAVLKFEDGTPVKLFDVPGSASFNDIIRWRPDGKAVTYRDRDRGVVLQLLNGEQPNRLEGVTEGDLLRFNWSHDGKLFAFTRGRALGDAVLLRDFR